MLKPKKNEYFTLAWTGRALRILEQTELPQKEVYRDLKNAEDVWEAVRNLRVSRFLPSAGKLKSLDFPGNTADMGFKQRTFAADFCDMHLEIGPRGAEDPLVYFACRIKCREKMKLAVHLGYDGPAKMWIDGKKAFYDPDGINPAIPDEGTGHFTANAGEHEVVVALGSNSGRAWGIFLRFERLDVTKLMVEQKPWTFAMPEILG